MMPSASGFTDGTGAGQPEPQHLVGVGMRCMMQVNFPRHEQSSGTSMFLLSWPHEEGLQLRFNTMLV